MFTKTSLKGRLNIMVVLETTLEGDVTSQAEKKIGGKGEMTELIISDLRGRHKIILATDSFPDYTRGHD